MIGKDPGRGLAELHHIKREALLNLPLQFSRLIGARIVLISMGRRSAQKQHDVVVESIRALLHGNVDLPIFVIFATTGGSPNSGERLRRIDNLAAEFPDHVASLDGRIDFYRDLVTLADFNIMCSLWEPHGSAFEGLMVPIARAVDGLLAQIAAFRPHGLAHSLNERWHEGESPNGFLFREEPTVNSHDRHEQYEALLKEIPQSHNVLFDKLVAELSNALVVAIETKIKHETTYVQILRAALMQQRKWSWKENFAMQLALIRDATNRRSRAAH